MSEALLQQFLVKHGDVITIRTLNSNSAGEPGWLHLGSNEIPNVAHGVDLPVSDKRFQWQVIKLSPNVTGGNQDSTYVTEGDDILLKSLENNLVLTFHGLRCGHNVPRAQLSEKIAAGNYYTSGEGAVSNVQLVNPDGSISRDRAVVLGLRPYALKFPVSHCFLSSPQHEHTRTSSSATDNGQYVLLPASGSLDELEARANLHGAVPLVKQEAHLQGTIDSQNGPTTPFAQLVSSNSSSHSGKASVMTTSVSHDSTYLWIAGGVFLVALVACYWYYGKDRKSKK